MKKGFESLPVAEAPGQVEVTFDVLNPRGDIMLLPNLGITPRVADLAGRKIGIYWVGKQGGNNFWDVVEKALKEKIPTATIVRYKGPFDLGDTMAAKLAKECDVFLYGVGD